MIANGSGLRYPTRTDSNTEPEWLTTIQHRLSTEGADPLLLAGVNDANLVELQRATGVRATLRGDTLTLGGIARAGRAGRRRWCRACSSWRAWARR